MTSAAETNSRERILDTGAALFLRDGFADTSLRRIGSEVGMQAASIYYHFASKDNLLQEILTIGMEAISETFLDDPTLPSRERFDRAIRSHLSALFELGPYTAAHVTVFRQAPRQVKEKIVPLRDAYEERWAALLEALAADGALVPDLDLRLARLTLLAMMNTALEWFRPGQGRSVDDLADAISRQFWSGVANHNEERP